MDKYTLAETAYRNGYNAALEDLAKAITERTEFIKLGDFCQKFAISPDDLNKIIDKMKK